MAFCENNRCQFNIALPEASNELRYRDANDDNKEKSIKRLHVVQQQAGGTAPPKDFYFCETCANVLAMTFGQPKTKEPKKENVTPKQSVG